MGPVCEVISAGYLVDTHILLWDLAADERLSRRHLALMRDAKPKFVSIVSMWEIAIKAALGKLRMSDDFIVIIREAGIEILPIRAEHTFAVRDLPHHHRDPFDRMLIAQARVEGLTMLTADRAFSAYDIEIA